MRAIGEHPGAHGKDTARMNSAEARAATIAGLLAGIGYVAASEIDIRLTGQNLDDLKLLGRPLVSNPAHAKAVGFPIHLVNSVAVAAVYALAGRKRLRGPEWLRGMTFAAIENTVLYPVAAFENRHPGVRAGEIDRYFTFKAYLQSIPRHLVYGAILGALYPRLARRA
jgi:hypothetical protein